MLKVITESDVSKGIKKKKVSKKNKSSWRKHIDVNDVEDFLENQRQEERVGTFHDKSDAELFILDSKAEEPQQITAKQKRILHAKTAPLRSFAILENTSKVSDPITKRNRVKNLKNGRNIEQEILNPKTQRHVDANKDRKRYNEKLDKIVKKNRNPLAKSFNVDLWKGTDLKDKYPDLKNKWISEDMATYTLKNLHETGAIKAHDSMRHKTIKTKKHFQAPHPGTSYNPDPKDHNALLKKAIEKEEGIIKTAKHLKRITTEMFSKVTAFERDSNILSEMGEHVGKEEEEEDSEYNIKEACHDLPYTSVNSPVVNKKKTNKTRRNEKEQKLLARELEKKKEAKKQLTDLHRLKHLNAEVKKSGVKFLELRKHRKKQAFKKKFETKRLGKLKFQEGEIDVNMKEDIAGNIRNIKTESNLLVDRFKNLQKRNIIPTSVDVGVRKRRKIKRFTRKSHKEPEPSLSKNNKKK